MSVKTISKKESKRLQALNQFENAARLEGLHIIAGIDEAGRGPLAGPVVAAACIIPEGILLPGVDDSKKLSPKKRAEIFLLIKNNPYIQFGVGIVMPDEIDRINIYQATIIAMLQAIEKLPCIPDILLVDGMKLAHPIVPCQKIIKGDSKSQSIAAASIIAKETRDQMMVDYHSQWKHYNFKQHKGYGTAMHLEAIVKYGPCPIHRRTFEPIRSMGYHLDEWVIA